MPRSSQSLLAILAVKRGSLSDTMDAGSPWSLTSPSRRWRATMSTEAAEEAAEAVLWSSSMPKRKGMKCAILDNRSTTTRTALLFLVVSGKPVTKSMDTDVHRFVGTSSGRRNPWMRRLEAFVRRHVSQFLMYRSKNCRNCGHQYLRVIRSKVPCLPGCPAMMESWCCLVMSTRRASLFGIQMRSSYVRSRVASSQEQRGSSISGCCRACVRMAWIISIIRGSCLHAFQYISWSRE